MNSSPFDTPMADGLVPLAIKAGQVIMAIYEKGIQAGEKADGSPVTEADVAAEEVILEGLSIFAPGIPVVAEEAVSGGHIPAACDRYFLVDPLDGTREFVNRNGEFTVNIALIEAGVPVAGVVYAPALGEIYWGEGSQAYSATVSNCQISHPCKVHAAAMPKTGMRILASRSHMDERTRAIMDRIEGAEILSVGSSLKLCWLASGKADFYPRMAPTMQWDIAAGHAVLRAAGGTIVNAETRALFAYELKDGAGVDGLRNSGFLAAADPKLLAYLLYDCIDNNYNLK